MASFLYPSSFLPLEVRIFPNQRYPCLSVVRFSAFRSRAMTRDLGDSYGLLPASFSQTPTPTPLCTPISTQGHPIHPRISRGSQPIPKYPEPSTQNQVPRTKYQEPTPQ